VTEEQHEQFVAFIANLAAMLGEEKASVTSARVILESAASCLIAAVFTIGKNHAEAEAVGPFARGVIDAALAHFYSPKGATQSRQLQA
jgi:hypothetical protein